MDNETKVVILFKRINDRGLELRYFTFESKLLKSEQQQKSTTTILNICMKK